MIKKFYALAYELKASGRSRESDPTRSALIRVASRYTPFG